MTTFEKAMTGDRKSVERFFFDSKGRTRSDKEADIIFNFKLAETERIARVAAIRS
jgi:hypothetical protein